LSWWSQAHDPHAVAVTPEMVSAYTRQVVHPQMLARFDAELAKLLTPSEWASIAGRLRPLGQPADSRNPS
jgi:hypothetical protein